MVIFYELLAGRRPFDPPAYAPRPPALPDLDPAWYAVLVKGLELQPDRRYASAAARTPTRWGGWPTACCGPSGPATLPGPRETSLALRKSCGGWVINSKVYR